MNKSRARILAKLKANQGQAQSSLPEAIDLNPPAGKGDQLIELFSNQCEINRTELHHVSNTSWTDKLCEIALEKNLRSWLIGTHKNHCEQAYSALGEHRFEVCHFSSPIETMKDTLFDTIDASITEAQYAIAETGTLVVIPDQHEPRTLSLVPPTHIVLLKQSHIIDTLQTCISKLPKPMPTNVLFISSPSKTADIQQTLAYGAHGPKELIVLLIED